MPSELSQVCWDCGARSCKQSKGQRQVIHSSCLFCSSLEKKKEKEELSLPKKTRTNDTKLNISHCTLSLLSSPFFVYIVLIGWFLLHNTNTVLIRTVIYEVGRGNGFLCEKPPPFQAFTDIIVIIRQNLFKDRFNIVSINILHTNPVVKLIIRIFFGHIISSYKVLHRFCKDSNFEIDPISGYSFVFL